mmetsp:Transcript_6284/g.12772  ORF Transcript_6284/g.12772 Transcript_6284/m.12772 type:complete len:106 (-) Transcript_6284:123-440(-)
MDFRMSGATERQKASEESSMGTAALLTNSHAFLGNCPERSFNCKSSTKSLCTWLREARSSAFRALLSAAALILVEGDLCQFASGKAHQQRLGFEKEYRGCALLQL